MNCSPHDFEKSLQTSKKVEAAGIEPALGFHDESPRSRVFPDWVREMAHSGLDEALDMYVRGEPLWIFKKMAFTSTTSEEFELEIRIKEWV